MSLETFDTAGLYVDVDSDAYFSDPLPTPSLTQSLIPDLLNKSPWHAAYRSPKLNPYGPGREQSKAMWLGEATHRIALGRGRDISEIRYANYSSSSAREARDEAVRNNRIPVLTNDLIKSRDMARLLRGFVEQEFKGEEYVTEVMIAWVEETPFGPIWCRGLLDAYCPALAYALDPKVLRIPATAEAFGPTAVKSGYDIQGRWYERGLSKVFPDLAGRSRFANLVVENVAPNGCAAFEPDAETKAAADFQINLAINRWAECLHSGKWPSYPRSVQQYSAPAWRAKQLLEMQYMEEN